MALVCQIAVINAFNRLNVMMQQRGGDYQLGEVRVTNTRTRRTRRTA